MRGREVSFVMLTIRKEQMAAMEDALKRRADARLLQYLRERFPEQTRPRQDEELARFVAAVRERARSHGVVDEADVASTLDLTVMYGANFYDADWARDVFAMNDWSGAEKMQLIRIRVRRQASDF
jgi:hypothetical protein